MCGSQTWVMLTGGSVSQAGFRLEVILVTMLGCGGTLPGPGALVCGAPPAPHPCGQMGLCDPLLELDDNLRLMKAISTVGSGLQHKMSLFLKCASPNERIKPFCHRMKRRQNTFNPEYVSTFLCSRFNICPRISKCRQHKGECRQHKGECHQHKGECRQHKGECRQHKGDW